ncbi:hypothetical protein SAMN05444278_10255 [Psychroflexus salarius]|uniref:CarboxypepD_reg-like domain-containing protein n=1 Tax=Psychroflexus salarius TaxID=1155689 RepID=A0A1M4TW94_9FLAO|nr:hypothetical protein [Psychroflexus salarius]SHE48728.1 hypothetical protein SAMN05444278_10255 [Psychroflexus salarius]
MNKCVGLLLFLSFGFNYAQIFEGEIIADSLDNYQINIVNISNKQGTTTRKNGRFSIPAEVNDSVVFLSIKHEFAYRIIKASDFHQVVEIPLKIEINQLPEVVLSQYDLTGFIEKDAQQIKNTTFNQKSITGFSKPRRLSYPQRELKRVSRFSIGPATSIPLDYIIMALNGDLAELKRLRQNNIISRRQAKLKGYFTQKYLVESLEIDSLYVEDFLYYCAEDLSLLKTLRNNKLAVYDSIQEKAKNYKRLKFNQ